MRRAELSLGFPCFLEDRSWSVPLAFCCPLRSGMELLYRLVSKSPLFQGLPLLAMKNYGGSLDNAIFLLIHLRVSYQAIKTLVSVSFKAPVLIVGLTPRA